MMPIEFSEQDTRTLFIKVPCTEAETYRLARYIQDSWTEGFKLDSIRVGEGTERGVPVATDVYMTFQRSYASIEQAAQERTNKSGE